MEQSRPIVQRVVETSLGPIPLTGVFDQALTVLAITGAFAPPEDMSRIPALVGPAYGGAVAALPGNRTPRLSETSIPAFARAFDEVVDALGPTVVLGVSVGGLVGLAMRSPRLRAIIAVDPPLATAKLWPLFPTSRNALEKERWFIEPILGVYEDRVEERAYISLLSGLTAPTHVVMGEAPLYPQRLCETFPSLVDEPERALLAAHPLVTPHIAAGAGHSVANQWAQPLLQLLLKVCADVAE